MAAPLRGQTAAVRSGFAAQHSPAAGPAFQSHPNQEKTTSPPQPISRFDSWGHPFHLQLKKSRFSLWSSRGVLLLRGTIQGSWAVAQEIARDSIFTVRKCQHSGFAGTPDGKAEAKLGETQQ